MTFHPESLPRDRDEAFEALIGYLRTESNSFIDYNARDKYYAIPLGDDLAILRNAYDDHIKTHYDLEPGATIPDEYYDIVEEWLNEQDAQSLQELHLGEIVSSTGSTPYFSMDFASNQGLEYNETPPGELLVGVYHRVVIVPVPKGPIGPGGLVVERREYEPVMAITSPIIEGEDGGVEHLHLPFVFVPFYDSTKPFIKRMYR